MLGEDCDEEAHGDNDSEESGPGSRALRRRADQVAASPLPAQKGAVKKNVMKLRPQQGKRPKGVSKCTIRLCQETTKSFIQYYDEETDVWRNVVNVLSKNTPNHYEVAQALFVKAIKTKIDKEGLVALRDTICSEGPSGGQPKPKASPTKPAKNDLLRPLAPRCRTPRCRTPPIPAMPSPTGRRATATTPCRGACSRS